MKAVLLYRNPDTMLYCVVVCVATYYLHLNTAWMANENIGKRGQLLNADTVESEEVFFDLESGLRRVAELYVEQLK